MPPERIAAGTAHQNVVAASSGEDIVPVTAEENIIAISAVKLVVSALPEKNLAVSGAGIAQHLVFRATQPDIQIIQIDPECGTDTVGM